MKQTRKKAASKKENFFTKLIDKIEDDLISAISKFIVTIIISIFFILIRNLCPNKLIELFAAFLEWCSKH